MDAGFSNCYDEWWHWSYGDAGWACRLGHSHAIYGLVSDVPEEALRQIEERRCEEERRAAEKDGKSASREGLAAP
jgi:D-alanyl-D-alanine dipeptidase